MEYAKTVQEYIDLFCSGTKVTNILVDEEIKEELIAYVEENKGKSDTILYIYVAWLKEGIFIEKNVSESLEIQRHLLDKLKFEIDSF